MPLLTLPSIPALPSVAPRRPEPQPAPRPRRADTWEEYAEREAAAAQTWDRGWDDEAEDHPSARQRAHSAARPLALIRLPDEAFDAAPAPLPTDSVPELAAFRPSAPGIIRAQRARVATRAVIHGASQPWSITRIVCVLIACVWAFSSSVSAAGEPSQPLMNSLSARAGSVSANVAPVTSKVIAETQGMRPDLYDSHAQFDDWWGAACSAAVLSEVLTAWGVPNATIGHEIDELGPDISSYAGLLRYSGFQNVAAKHGYRADIRDNLTYGQMLYLTNHLGLPLIVNVRISYGYYHFFSGGHFLVMTGGDQQGLRIVDSSEYYLTYLPGDVFSTMFTGHTILIVPQDYQYTLPNV